jgi:2-polyprenyl-6-methoxyphenol hydroxylase-like FAD-dependent oxidoreductase
MPDPSRQLLVLIVGGGIGGLAAALARKDCRVSHHQQTRFRPVSLAAYSERSAR